jgi:uncharacterized protein (TIGR02453 family)
MTSEGFTVTTISFLKSLSLNNNKDWFDKNRTVYEEHILSPLKQLAADLGLVVKSIDNKIETTPAINKTISRIYRDTRFSNDKSPFRTDAWISFKRPAKVWGNVPEFYFYFTPEEYQYGMGFYSATPENMEKYRYYISLHPDRFREIIDHYNSQTTFILVGDDYKKHIANPYPAEYQRWFQKRNLCMSCIRKPDDTFFSSGLGKDIEDAFRFNAVFYSFLMDCINQ